MSSTQSYSFFIYLAFSNLKVNCCTIDWFDAWPSEALQFVARRMFESTNDPEIGNLIESLSMMFTKMHRTVELGQVICPGLRNLFC